MLIIFFCILCLAVCRIEDTDILGPKYTLSDHLRVLMLAKMGIKRMYNRHVLERFIVLLSQAQWQSSKHNEVVVHNDQIHIHLNKEPNKCIVLHELMHLAHIAGLEHQKRPKNVADRRSCGMKSCMMNNMVLKVLENEEELYNECNKLFKL